MDRSRAARQPRRLAVPRRAHRGVLPLGRARTLQKKPKVTDHKFMTAPLNLWAAPQREGQAARRPAEGGKVAVTGVRRPASRRSCYDGQVRWVNQRYLADKMPARSPTSDRTPGLLQHAAPAAAAARRLHRALPRRLRHRVRPHLRRRSRCSARSATPFPALTTYGGYDAHGEHSSGRAIDFMITATPPSARRVADWARAHAGELNLYDVIWQQHIWTPVRSSEGWRVDARPWLPDREPLRPRAHLGQLAPASRRRGLTFVTPRS